MNSEDRDRLLRRAWEFPPFDDRVMALSDIARRIGPSEDVPPSAPTDLPMGVRALAEEARQESLARGGGGTHSPGEVVLRHAPDALRVLSRRFPQPCVLVSATNGKTTTASMIAAILREDGRTVTHNRAGANMPAGVVTALLEEPGEIGVFEVDEAWLPVAAAELSPGAIVLGNLFRDRLDGYGELDSLAESWNRMASGLLRARLVLNADDAVIAGLRRNGDGSASPPPLFFGVEDRALDLPETEHAVDSIRCSGCEEPLEFDIRLLSHLGHHRCESCGAGRPEPDVFAARVSLDGISASSFSIDGIAGRFEIDLGLPGLYNVYNALAAIATALALGVDPSAISRALSAFSPVFGRGQRLRAGTTDLLVLLMKNPAGANELLRTLGRDAAPTIDLLIALNDGWADGRDVSWIWDADFEALQRRVGRVVCTGNRAAELALRLKYAGWPVSQIAVDTGIASALDRGISEAGERLIVLPTYSALLELQSEFALRGLARPFWSGAQVLPGDPP